MYEMFSRVFQCFLSQPQVLHLPLLTEHKSDIMEQKYTHSGSLLVFEVFWMLFYTGGMYYNFYWAILTVTVADEDF